MGGMHRRDFLKAGAAAGALLLARPLLPTAAAGTGLHPFPTSRASRLFNDGKLCVHSDLHNHSLLSDGAANPDTAFAVMRSSGLDAAALTDHAILGKAHAHITCPEGPCTLATGINRDSWDRMRVLANAADDPGSFAAIRGFEWTSGHHGHINVWLTENWTDPLLSHGLVHPEGLANFIDSERLGPIAAQIPDPLSSMDGFYEWLRTPAAQGGGGDGLAGFNHPNSWGNFEDFRYVPEAASQMVSCEIYTGAGDYLYQGVSQGKPSPINACLNAGWRVGMLGVTDEHGTQFGMEGKGRGGLWVNELSRAGVFEALAARRFFATREMGLRVDAAATGSATARTRMGGALPHTAGPVTFEVDIAGGSGWVGREILIEVFRPGADLPRRVFVEYTSVPADTDPVITFTVPGIDSEDGGWVLLRIADPHGPADPRAPDGSRVSIAYPSPFYLSPA